MEAQDQETQFLQGNKISLKLKEVSKLGEK